MDDFRDKIVFMTGGGSGIGKSISEALAGAGAFVAVTDSRAETAAAVADAIRASGGKAESHRLDVRDAAAFQALVEDVVARHGRIDFLFNNAGIGMAADVRDVSLEDWNRIIDINLKGVIHGVMAAYPIMARQGFGHIVNTSSLSGLVGFPTGTPYAMTKAAVVSLSRDLRVEAHDLGVRVTALCPGFIDTGIYENTTAIGIAQEKVRRIVPFKLISAAEAARLTLEGVRRNKAIIVFPRYGRTLWWLSFLFPERLAQKSLRGVRKFRRLRET
jgi:NAD(P)-dependent dehydrogenase (short-subunit alcohol dehydrogenase family)